MWLQLGPTVLFLLLPLLLVLLDLLVLLVLVVVRGKKHRKLDSIANTTDIL